MSAARKRPPARRAPGPRRPPPTPSAQQRRAARPTRASALTRDQREELPPGATDATGPDRGYLVAVLSVVAASACLHLWKLGYRPLAHDEAIDAWFSWQARNLGVMKYDPVYHGPLRFYLEGLGFHALGTGAGAARAVAALAGIVATALIATRRGLLGRWGAPAAALLFTISPTALTVTRTGREDSLTGLVSLAMLLMVADALRRGAPTERHLIGLGALLAVSWSIKETTFIFGFAAVCFLVALAVAWYRGGPRAARFYRGLAAVGWRAWVAAGVAFLAVMVVVFTSMLRYPGGLESGLLDGLRYWLSQHEVGRGGQRWTFYLTVLFAYEWLLLVFAGAGAGHGWRRRDPIVGWFASMALVQLVVYTWAGEKFAWLMLHPIIPMVLLAGIGVQAIVDGLGGVNLRRPTHAALASVTALAAAATLFVAVRPAITHGDDTRELLVTVQTSGRVRDLAAEFRRGQDAGTLGPILVDDRDSGSWPWVWYLHELDVAYLTIDPTEPLPEGYDVYLVAAVGFDAQPPPIPDGFTVERFPLRGWWLPDWQNAGVGDVANWFFTRHTWNPTGSSDQFVIRRAD